MKLLPSNRVLPKTVAIPGYNHFLTPLRAVYLDYRINGPNQEGMKSYLRHDFLKMAANNPDVEFIVRQVSGQRSAVVRGLYVNGRDKVICVNKLEKAQVGKKIDVLLNASGAKIKHLKNLQLEAAPGGVAARGIWSSIHDKSAAHGGYKI